MRKFAESTEDRGVCDYESRATLWRPPAQFLVDQVHVLPKGKVLDVAAGYGRNALFLAEHGFSVHAVDRDQEALQRLLRAARERRLSNVTTEVRDLEVDESNEEIFPANAYDAVIVFFYLFRPLFPALLRTLKPRGVLLYETFLVENYLRYHRPKHKDFCLEPGFVARRFKQTDGSLF
jgi:SAM-dependent methyltransferase